MNVVRGECTEWMRTGTVKWGIYNRKIRVHVTSLPSSAHSTLCFAAHQCCSWHALPRNRLIIKRRLMHTIAHPALQGHASRKQHNV